MLVDLRKHTTAAIFDCDVAIVGAGAAGLTLARHLAGRGREIVVVESGGLDFDEATQGLADGPNLGDAYYPLVHARLRFFGGTTNVWGGRCARLEAIDFAQRDWVPLSGWPIALDEIERWYAAAASDLQLGPDAAGPDGWNGDHAERLGVDPVSFVTRLWHFDDVVERFAKPRAADIVGAPDVRVLLHATVVRVQAAASAKAVTGLDLATLDGRRAQLRAKHFVLACGGVENARLLLASSDVEPHGIGNAHDQVGRCFMEHPHGRAGVLEAHAGFELWQAFQPRLRPDGTRVAPVLLPAPAFQREARILNSAFTFKMQRDRSHGLPLHKRIYNDLREELSPTRGKRQFWHAYRRLRRFVQRTTRERTARARFARGQTRVHVIVRAEQAPNPASRVTLAPTRDALGMPHAALCWRRSELDKRTVRLMAERLGTALAQGGVGKLEPASWLYDGSTEWPVDVTVSSHPIGGYHHMGTTRMSVSPAEGVVDRDGRVHGYANLYVAGSSIFPTAGWANPTLTILALTHRLGDHLLARMA